MAVCQVTSTPDKEQNFKHVLELDSRLPGWQLAWLLPEAFDFIARDPEETTPGVHWVGTLEEYTQLARYQGKGEGEVVSF